MVHPRSQAIQGLFKDKAAIFKNLHNFPQNEMENVFR